MELKLENNGGMLTYKDGDGADRCLGHLMDFKDHGVYDAEHGKVSVTPEVAAEHNRILDEALIRGLDENCKVNYGGTFYTGKDDEGRTVVKTFMGTIVADHQHTLATKSTIQFRRNGMEFRGRRLKDADCFNFRRVK